MRLFKPALASLALALLTACASYTVKYDYDPRATYNAYKTYDWYAASARAKGKAQGQESPIMDRRVRAAVDRELAAKGFKLKPEGEPDVLVTYYPVYQDRAMVTSIGPAFGHYGWGWGHYGYFAGPRFQEVRHYKEGSIVLEVVDNKTNSLVWQAVADGALTDITDPQDADEQVAQAVRKMLERFPPKANP